MDALYDVVWLLDGIMGIFFKAVIIILALSFLSKHFLTNGVFRILLILIKCNSI